MAVKRYNGTDWVTEAGATPPTTATGFRNAIINGDFRIWQRGTSFSSPAANTLSADRWKTTYALGPTTTSVTRQPFSIGISSTLGVEAEFYLRSTITTVGTATRFSQEQFIEDVRTFAGQTVTLSFWAKADSVRSVGAVILQNFGTGGSSQVSAVNQSISLTTSWERYTVTTTVPSISGKTIGTNSSISVRFDQALASGSVLDLWGVQLEEGSIATPFEQRPIGTELALCQRYYQRITPDISISSYPGFNDTTTTGVFMIPFTQTMRVKPTALETSGTATDYAIRHKGSSITTCNTLPSLSGASTSYINFVATVASGLTAGESSLFRFGNANVAYLGWSAEL
jgi:hypothetical protein